MTAYDPTEKDLECARRILDAAASELPHFVLGSVTSSLDAVAEGEESPEQGIRMARAVIAVWTERRGAA